MANIGISWGQNQQAIFSDDFSGVTGNRSNPSTLNASQVPDWTVSASYMYGANKALKFNSGSKFTGSIKLKNPLDLSGNNGAFSVKVKALSWAKDNTTVKVRALSGNTELESLTHQFKNGTSPYGDEQFEEYTFEFTKGNASTVIEFTGSKRFFLSEVIIFQEAQAVPALVLSADSYDFGKVITGESGNSTGLTITGENLTGAITATVGGDHAGDFTASLDGTNVNVTFTPQATGIRNATVTFSSEGAENVVLTLTGEGVVASTPIIGIEGGYSLDNPLALSLNLGTGNTVSGTVDVTLTNITTDPNVTIAPETGTAEGIFTQESLFDPASGTGMIEVKFQVAEAGEYAATVTLTSGTVSESFRVTGICVKPELTMVPAYDFGVVGVEQSVSYELIVKGSNLTNNVMLNWAEGTNADGVFNFTPTSLTKDEVMSENGARVNVIFTPKAVQSYSAQLLLTPQSGNVYAYNVNFTGEGRELPKYTWTEDFEDYKAQTNYNSTYASSTGRQWKGSDALVGNIAGDKKNGANSVRIRNTGTFELLTPKPNGVGVISVSYANYSSNTDGRWSLYVKQGDGEWIKEIENIACTGTLTSQEFTLNKSGDIYIKIQKESGGDRINIDDILMTDYISTEPIVFVTGETDFGKYEIGQPAVVKNIVIKGQSLSGDDLVASWTSASGAFSADLTQITANAVSTENGLTLPVSFAPATAGEYTDTLLIRGAGITPVTIGFKGVAALPVPEITVDPVTLDFGKAVMGTTLSKQVKVTGRNLDRDLKVSVSTGMFICAVGNIPAADAMSEAGFMVEVTFAPVAFQSEAFTGTLTVGYDENIFVEVPLTGIGTDPNANDGSAEKPYSIKEAIENQGQGNAWFRGFIVGSTNDGSTLVDPALNTNILLADAATGYAYTLPVQLPSGNVRDQLNVKENPGNVGKEVMIKANLEAYFGNTPGAKNASDFTWIASSTEITSNTQIDKDTTYQEVVVSTPEVTIAVGPSLTITAEELTLPVAADGQAAQVELGEGASFTATRLVIEKTIPATGHWHFMSMPFDLNTENIRIKTTGATARLEQDIRILRYDAQARAQGNMDRVWTTQTSATVIPANTGFALQISRELEQVNSPLQFISSGEVSVRGANAETALTNHDSQNVLDRFVNFIGIPYLSGMGSQSFYVTGSSNCVALYQYDSQQDLYHTRLYTDERETEVHPYEALFMQAGQVDDRLTYNYLRTPIVKAVAAPYPRVELTMDNDRTVLVFDEQASSDFRVNEDGVKMPGMNLTTPMLYLQSTDGQALSVSVEPETGRTLRLGVRPGTEGQHTIALGASTSYQATAIELQDGLTGQWVDLLRGGYTFTAGETAEQKDRFTLRVVKSPSALNQAIQDQTPGAYLSPTGELVVRGAQAGCLVQVTDLQGRILQSRPADGNPMTFSVGSGLYLVRIGETVIKVLR